jgi:DNA-directed RNA polymerase specialized sigma24 family protein
LEIAHGSDATQAIQAAEEVDILLQRLTELPERERIAIHAFFLQECNARQAAALLDLSLSSLYAILERGLSRLASRMGRHGEKEQAQR